MSVIRISYSVGENGKNHRPDVFAIQKALNLVIKGNLLSPQIPLKEDGVAGQKTKAAIRLFQQALLRFSIPDGRIDPSGRTLEKLNSTILLSKQSLSVRNPDKMESRLAPSALLSGAFGSQSRINKNLNIRPNGAVSENVDLQSLTKDEFVRRVFEAAKKEELSSGVPAAVTAAQAILETGFGKSVPTDMNTKKYSYNLFGIKGAGTAGSVDVYTHEVVDGKRIKIIGRFQAYNSFAESISGRTNFLKRNLRYKFLFNSKDPKVWAEGLQKAGYATDPNYAKTLISIMNSWRLI